jgi:Icc-related predicted phosphoesterase
MIIVVYYRFKTLCQRLFKSTSIHLPMGTIAFVGDIHGNIDLMLEKVRATEADRIFQVGDFGTFLSEDQMDRATRKHNELGDFRDYYNGEKKFDIYTQFIKGNHEWFDTCEELEGDVIENLHYIPNGRVVQIGSLRIGILGGNYSPVRYHLPRNHDRMKGGKRKFFSYQDVEDLEAAGPLDIVVAHDCPYDIGIMGRHSTICGSPEVREFIERTQPSLYIHGHYHRGARTSIGKTEVITLGIIHRDDSLFLMEY